MPEFESELLGNCDEIVEYISSKLGLFDFDYMFANKYYLLNKSYSFKNMTLVCRKKNL